MENLETNAKGDTSRWKNWAIGFGIWTVVGISFGMRSYFYAQTNGTPVSFWDVVPNYMIDFYVWGAFSPLIFKLVKRVHIERGNMVWGLAFHIFAGRFVIGLAAIRGAEIVETRLGVERSRLPIVSAAEAGAGARAFFGRILTGN